MISESERKAIVEAIRQAEAKTSGEIFCVIARASSEYRLVPLAWGGLIALLTPLPLLYLTAWPATVIYALQLVAFLGATVGLGSSNIRYRIVPRRTKHDRAHAEALRQFWAHGLHLTHKRTGVLIFVSVAERYAEIVADAGINEKVMPEVWSKAVAALTAGIKAGGPGDGFLAAIAQCGAVLAEHFPLPPGAVNPDELPDKVVEI